MPTHAVSFTIKSDSGYQTRYDSLVEQIRLKGTVWEETTSFALVQTTESLSDFESRLYLKSSFSHLSDKMLVMQVEDVSAISRGKLIQPTRLKNLLQKVVRKSTGED